MGMADIFVMWHKPLILTFIRHLMEAPHELWLQSACLTVSKEKKFENVESALDQGQGMTLTFDILKDSFTYLVDCNLPSLIIRLQ